MIALGDRSATVDRAAVIALAIAAVVQLIALAVVPQYGFDSANHLSWIEQWHSLWSHGIIYPRWLPDAFSGYGSPAPYFYPPLTYACSSLLYLAVPGASVMTITKLLIGISLIASGMTMWLYLSRIASLSTRSAMFGTMLYMFAPYRFLDYSARCALSEHITFVFVPLVFWGAHRIIQREPLWPSGLLFVASLALAILTNIPGSATIFFGLAILILIRPRSEWLGHLLRIALLSILAFGLVAFFLWPVLFVHSDLSVFAVGWLPGFLGTGSPILGLLYGFAPTLDALNSLCYIGAAILLYHYWKMRKQETTMGESLGWILVLFVLLQLPYIFLFLFYHVPPFSLIQVPSRMTILLLFFLAVRWGQHLDHIRVVRVLSIIIIGWAVGTMVIAGGRIMHHPSTFATKPTAGASSEFKTIWLRPGIDTEYALATHGVEPASNHDKIFGEGVTGTTLSHRSAYKDTIEYQNTVNDSVSLHRAYWASWDVRIDGKQTSIWPDSLGRLAFIAPAGSHTIIASFEPTFSEIEGRYISLASLIATGIMFALFRRRRKANTT